MEEMGGDAKCDLSDTTAARIPGRGPIKNTCSKRIMLVGDAAGMMSPATGEGIYYAIESGKIAAETAEEILSGAARVSTLTYQRDGEMLLVKTSGLPISWLRFCEYDREYGESLPDSI